DEHDQRRPDGGADRIIRERDLLALRLCAAESVGDDRGSRRSRNEWTARATRPAVAAARNESPADTNDPAGLPLQRDRDAGPQHAPSLQRLKTLKRMKRLNT